jgi:hypothetical protein
MAVLDVEIFFSVITRQAIRRGSVGNESRYSASTREASNPGGRRGVAQQVLTAPLPGM